MNQLPVRSNGGFGRGFARLAGRERAQLPGLSSSCGVRAGADVPAQAAAARGEQPATARLSGRDEHAATESDRHRARPYFDSGVPSRAGRSSSVAAVGQRERDEDAGRLAAAHRVHHHRHLVARLDGVRLPAGANQVGRARQLDAPHDILALALLVRDHRPRSRCADSASGIP